MVLRLDELVELLAEFGLYSAAEGAEAESMARGRAGTVLVGADGECAIPMAVLD